MTALRKWLFSGLLVLVPLIVTLWVLDWVVGTLDQTLNILPTSWRPDAWLGVHVPGLGVLFALVIVLSIGALASNIIGNKLVHWWHALLHRIPVVRSIYSGVKQVSDTLFSEKGNAFRKALLVQWPHEGMWTIAFLTGSPQGDLLEQLQARPGSDSPQDEFLSVYVPTTPNPTGGYFVLLRARDCVELAMSVDEALTYIVSMGVIVPGVGNAAEARQAVESALFPPAGRRSITTSLPQLHFRPAGAAELEDVNAATLVGVMIETAGALENAEAIAAVPGIDLLHVGLHDLAASLGYRDRPPDEAVMEALAPVIAAARRHGKHVGIGGAGTAGPLLAALIDAGARYVSAGTDLSFLLAAAGERCAAVRRLFDGGIRPEDHNARQ